MVEYEGGTVGEISTLRPRTSPTTTFLSTVRGITVQVEDDVLVRANERVPIRENLLNGRALAPQEAFPRLVDDERLAVNQLVAFFSRAGEEDAPAASRSLTRRAALDPTTMSCIEGGVWSLVDDVNPVGIGELCQIAVDGCLGSMAASGLTPEELPAMDSMSACVAAGACTGVDLPSMLGAVGSCLGCSAFGLQGDGGAG